MQPPNRLLLGIYSTNFSGIFEIEFTHTMKANYFLVFSTLTLFTFSCTLKPKGKHLFILSGQSNMALLDPAVSFTPAVEEAFGKDNVIVVKDAWGGQPIMRWYKNWELDGKVSETGADLYDSLMTKVNMAIQNEKLASISFLWMQGERDARENYGAVYEESLIGIHSQIGEDLGREDTNYVIGRLSDFGIGKENRPDWMMIRDIQVNLAASNPRFEWIDTDDLNDGINQKGDQIKDDLHMSVEGYSVMGERFAQKAIQLIKANQ